MASTKKSGFIIETKPVSEKKRRKSDLVVMWITLWDVILYILTETWLTIQGVLEVGKIFFKADDVRQIREWLAGHLPQVPDDFSHSWRDGVLFCKLLNKLQPGCFPGTNKLDTNFGVQNLSKAFLILETRFDIIPNVTVEEIVTCSKDSDQKLVNLLLQLKQKTDDNENNSETKPAIEEIENVQENGTTEVKDCIAKGTGLMVGFVGRAASFGVFFSSLSDLNLVVMIKGPSNTICSERVTKRSPKKKNTVKPWKPLSPHAMIRSASNEESVAPTIIDNKDNKAENEKYIIPLEYEIHSNQVSFTYYPLVQGEHRIAVLSHGQHVSDSTYVVNIEPAIQGPKLDSMPHIKSVLKPSRRHQKSEEEQPKKTSVRFQEPSERKERLGKILKRQVLRYIVKIDGKDVVVDADSINNLSTSLLKMDYELQKRPLVRRNSWGFVGDAERKISVIRQFGIDIDELESQSIKMQRSHSLSLSPITKRPPKISSSYECEDIIPQTILETVTEGRISYFNNSSVSHEEDDIFALVDRDFDCHLDVKSRGAVDERGDFDFNSWKYTGDNFVDNSFYAEDTKEVDQYSATRQEQMPPKLEVADSQNSISAIGIPEDNLRSKNECSSRLDTHIGEECVAEEKSEIKIESMSSGIKNNSQTTQFSFLQDDYVTTGKRVQELNLVETKKRIVDVENSIEQYKNLEPCNTVFVEELPCTKTNAKTVSNYTYQKNMLTSSDPTKAVLNKYENLPSNKIILPNNCEDSMPRKENNSFVKNCGYKFSKKRNTYDGNLNNSVKNLYSINEQLKSKIINIPKIRCKSLVLSNTKKNKTRCQRFHKYQHLGQKFQGNNNYCCAKRNRSSSKTSIEDSSAKKLQCIMKNVNYEDISNLSKRQLFKSVKNRTVSDPTYNSFNRNEENTNLEFTRNKNALRVEKYEDKEKNYKHISDSSCKQSIDLVNYLSNFHSNRNEYGTTFWPETSNINTEFTNLPQHHRKNFNICQKAKTNNVLKCPMIYEPFSECAMNSTPKQFCETFVRSNCENSSESNQSKDSISKNLCQFTYKHFNPSFQIDRESTVRKQINLWETSTMKRQPISKQVDKLHVLPELVDMKAKLKFWENAYHHPENEELKDINISKHADDTCRKEEGLSLGINLEGNGEKLNQVPLDHGSKRQTPININDSNCLEKSVDNKVLNSNSTKSKTRSFSDPGVLDKPDDLTDDTLHSVYRNEIVHPSSSKDEMSSSNDGNFIELFADDEESSMELLCSTEDEYIDDEISENISTYWGDLSLMKGLKVYDCSEYDEFLQLMNSESLQSCADECKFFGIATYFGHVAVKNRFWVLTKGAGRGNLSASVQGIGQHNVAFLSVEYTRKDIYEVTYQVFTPGLYLISVRWMDTPISGSPFLCKVTF